MNYPTTRSGKELYRLAEAVAVKLEPDGGGPFVAVAVLAVELVRNQVVAIESEAVAVIKAALAIDALWDEPDPGTEDADAGLIWLSESEEDEVPQSLADALRVLRKALTEEAA